MLFGLSSLLTAYATSAFGLTLFRFLTGLGLGGVLPNLIALSTEYAPQKQRSKLTMLAFCGLSFGSMIAGFIGAWLIPRYGWQSIFIVGGLLPLLIAAVLPKVLPESIRYYAARGGNDGRIAAILSQLAPEVRFPPRTRFTTQDASPVRPSPLRLFGDGRSATTVVMTLTVVCNSFSLYFLLNWLPILMKEAGLTAQAAAYCSALLSAAGGVGVIFIGRVMDRFGSRQVMIATCALAAAGIAAVGSSTHSTALLLIVLLPTGATVLCTLTGLFIVVAELYPTTIRSTGAGFTLGLGRVGSILGPMAGGWALAAAWPTDGIFVMGALPVLFSCVLLWLLGRLPRNFH